jgi:GxxExxY protein
MKQQVDEGMNRLTQAVIGAAIEVHRELGPGFLEVVYEDALCIELESRGIGFVRQAAVEVLYKGRIVGQGFIDLFVEESLIVELKAVEQLLQIHTAQVISYLKATGLPLGLLINFNVPKLVQGVKRIVYTDE